jgi:glycopeptide antibiotics resistance protein
MTPNLRGFLYGTGLMAVVSSSGLCLALANVIENWNFLLLGSIFLAAFVTGLAATSRRFWLAFAQAAPALLIVLVLFTIAFRYDGRWENVGFDSVAFRTLLFAPLAIVLCAAGGGLAWLLTRGSKPDNSLERTRER